MLRSGTVATLAALLVGGCVSGAAPASQKEPDARVQGAPAPSAIPAPSASLAPAPIVLCPTTISNPPPVDANGVARAGPMVEVKGVRLFLMPATGVCLSSGYGERNGRLHRGVDYFAKVGGAVVAAADGVVVERAARADFGNMVVIDHGADVFTRYAHLESFAPGLAAGARVSAGAALGPVGSTGATSVRHLHFEVLVGKYVAGAGSFGLTALNPFDLPMATAVAAGRERKDRPAT